MVGTHSTARPGAVKKPLESGILKANNNNKSSIKKKVVFDGVELPKSKYVPPQKRASDEIMTKTPTQKEVASDIEEVIVERREEMEDDVRREAISPLPPWASFPAAPYKGIKDVNYPKANPPKDATSPHTHQGRQEVGPKEKDDPIPLAKEKSPAYQN